MIQSQSVMTSQLPQFPIYIPSKGREDYMYTSKSLSFMGIHHYVVVEPSQVIDYEKSVENMQLLVTVLPMDMSYKDKYEVCDNFGLSQSTGAGPARNFAWDHSIELGAKYHWVMDDNIRDFLRLNKNEKVKCTSASYWAAMEDFCLRYTNVAMAGPNYRAFAPHRLKRPPFVANRRVYSCNFIRNDIPFRWRGRHNEDTILSIDILKAGWCTILFNAFLIDKMETQLLKGGNTEEFYHKLGSVDANRKYTETGTLAKSLMLVKVHPDISRMVYKYNRVHHHVDYESFRNQKLIKHSDYKQINKINNYGMSMKAKR